MTAPAPTRPIPVPAPTTVDPSPTPAPSVSTAAENVGGWSIAADVGTVIAALAALATLYFTFRAIRQASRLHKEASQPYVVASLEPHQQVPSILELVVSNLGKTAATDVVVSIDPTPVRITYGVPGKSTKRLSMPETFSVLVPGQRWSTTWDSIAERDGEDLDKRHNVTIAYRGIDGKEQPETKFVLDWDMYFNRRHIEIKTVHHAVAALRSIDKKLGNLQE